MARSAPPRMRHGIGALALFMLLGGLPAAASGTDCPGDCNQDSVVTVDELLRGINVALGNLAVVECGTFDLNHDGAVTVDELLIAVSSAVNGCPAQNVAFVIATDFESGSFGVITLDEPRSVLPSASERFVNSDAVARVFDGLIYVVNRFFGDNIQVLDPDDDFSTRLQCLTGERSNPHDIALVSATKAYVTLADSTDLLIANPSSASDCSDFAVGSIDLSEFADADGLPEMDKMVIVGDRLYVSIQRLDRNNFFAPAGNGSIVVIDIASDEVVGEIMLSGQNPFGETKGLTVIDGAIVVAELGAFGVNDGGIERIDLAAGAAQGFFVTEEDLGGDITDFVLVSPSVGYAVLSLPDFTNSVVAFDPTAGTVIRTLVAGSDFVSDLELNDRGELFVADRTATRPGVRIFRAADGSELTSSPLDLGLPPFNIVFLH